MNIFVCKKIEIGDFMIYNVVFFEDWVRLVRFYIYM